MFFKRYFIHLTILFLLLFFKTFYIKMASAGNYRLSLTDYPFPERLELCGEKVPLEDSSVRERFEREFYIALGDEAQILLWLKRSGRYFPELEKILRERQMPQDLKYVVVAESSLLTQAYSSKGASGYWQFVQSTGERYGLKKGDEIDERLSFVKATEAALNYLRDLYRMFGSWTLALAAYNCGEKKIQREIDEQKVNDFYYLALPQETERYIFRILAIKTILSHPEQYGVKLKREDYYQPYDFDTVKVVIRCPIHLRLIAEAADTYYRKIRELNPEFKGYHLPPGEYLIRIPKGVGRNFNERFANLLKKIPCMEKMVYQVKKGDTLSKIADTLNVPIAMLMEWNQVSNPDLIKPGEELIYYRPLQDYKP